MLPTGHHFTGTFGDWAIRPTKLKIGKATIGNWSAPTARHRASSVRNFNGCMDEMIVFGEALDDQEVRRIYEVGRP